ncbi:MAG: lanthionine synthetase LanC family protein [Gemmatimonadota bacterium]
MSSPAERWLRIAEEIAESLCASAYRFHGECTWMGSVQRGGGAIGGNSIFTYETLPPDLYNGASGIGLFLAEMFRHTKHGQMRTIALEALRFSAARLDQIPARFRAGFYTGRVGIAYALVQGGTLLDEPALIADAHRILDVIAADEGDGILLDIISGAAGAIAPLLAMSSSLARDDLFALSEVFGRMIIVAAHRGDTGWSWGDDATGFHAQRPLAGYGHGAAGLGLGLMELFAVTGEEEYRVGALSAFGYENALFSSSRGNWPDLRYSADSSDNGHFGVAWCLGAQGIGMSRLRAMALDPLTAQHVADAEAAIGAVQRQFHNTIHPGSSDFSLCHGFAGDGDFALQAADALEREDVRRLAHAIAESGAVANGGSPTRWHCGLQRGSNPSLMLGLAGIGHFYLRLADPSVPSVLLVTPELNR